MAITTIPTTSGSDPIVGKVIGKVIFNFLHKDVPSEVMSILKGLTAPFKLVYKSGVWVKRRIKGEARSESGECGDALAQTTFLESARQLPGNAKNAATFFKEQLTFDLAEMTPKERGIYLAKIGAYFATICGSTYLGNEIPDKDIKLMGIGSHRNAFFHSSLSAAAIRLCIKLVSRTISTLEEEELIEDSSALREVKKCLVLAQGGVALGVGAHLIVDGGIQNGKAVIFGDMGSLVNGTLMDDNAWLLINGFVSILMGKEDITGEEEQQ